MKILLASVVMFVFLVGIWSASFAQEDPPPGRCDPPPEKPKK